jgi:IS30 family transposase
VLQPRLRAVIEAKLALRWSPEQIAGWLPLAYPSDPVLRVSHETIYLSLFIQSRGALRRELQRCLRTGRAMRYPRGKRLAQGRGQLRDTLHISQRPPEAADRAVPGTGKATWSSAGGPARSGPWSSATAAMWCCSPSLTGSPQIVCARN